MTTGEHPLDARLRLFAFFPYTLALGLGFVAQTLMWSNLDIDQLSSLLRLGAGALVWVIALTVFAVGDRARQIMTNDEEAPWEKPNPAPPDRLLRFFLEHLGPFLAAVGLVAFVAIWLPLV